MGGVSSFKAMVYGASLLWPVVALAYDGTDVEQQACTPDVFSLCSAYVPDEGPIVACLKSKRVQLSPACAQVLFPQVNRRHRRAG